MSSKLLDEIKKLSAMELASLVKEIEEAFGVSAAMPTAVAAAPAESAAGGAAQEDKSDFKVSLKEAGAEKIKVIKALRAAISGLALKDAKELAESAPCVIAESASKEDASKMKELLEAAGAKVELS
jgi:large subunit ribosomal protein L7/L12